MAVCGRRTAYVSDTLLEAGSRPRMEPFDSRLALCFLIPSKPYPMAEHCMVHLCACIALWLHVTEWDAWKGRMAAFLLSHRYAISLLVLLVVASCIAAGAIYWRQRSRCSAQRPWSPGGDYDACPQNELSISSTLTSVRSDSIDSSEAASWQDTAGKESPADGRV